MAVETDDPYRAEPGWDRHRLNNELFRRPPIPVSDDALVLHASVVQDPEQARESIESLREAFLPERAALSAKLDYEILVRGDLHLKWERHNEFTSYTLATKAPEGQPFAPAATGGIDPAFFSTLPGQCVAATKIRVISEEDEDLKRQALALLRDNVPASQTTDGMGELWMDCAIAEDGYTRALLCVGAIPEERRARLVQRIAEIETYRMTAMLGFPVARDMMGELSALETRLHELIHRVADEDAAQAKTGLGAPTDEASLHELLLLASEVERIQAGCTYRFSASRAYFDLVTQRVEELREQRIPGRQRVGNFLQRRLQPAAQTIDAVGNRLEALSRHTADAAGFLRTRVDLSLNRQNRELLASMNQRAEMQLRLQRTVEGLSVVAISYYGIGIVNYLSQAAEKAAVVPSAAVVTGLAAPVVIAVTFALIRRIRKSLHA